MLKIYLLKICLRSTFHWKNICSLNYQISSATIALTLVCICQSLFNFLYFINVYCKVTLYGRRWILHIKICQNNLLVLFSWYFSCSGNTQFWLFLPNLFKWDTSQLVVNHTWTLKKSLLPLSFKQYFNHPDGNFRLCLRHPTNWQIMRTNLNSHNRTPWTLLALFEASCPCSWQARRREWPHSAWFLPPELWRTFWFSKNFLRGVEWVGGSIWGTCQNRLWRGDLTLKNWIVYLFLIFLNLPKLYSYIILAVLSYACTTT